MSLRLGLSCLVLLAAIGPAWAEKTAAKPAGDGADVQKINHDSRLVLASTASDTKSKEQARQWLENVKPMAWGEANGRYQAMGQDKKGWWVRVMAKNGEVESVYYDNLDADSQKRLKEMWNLKYYIAKAAEKLPDEAPKAKPAKDKTALTEARKASSYMAKKKAAMSAAASQAMSSGSKGGGGRMGGSMGSSSGGKCGCGK